MLVSLMITILFSIQYEPITDFELSSQNRIRAFVKEAKIKLLLSNKSDQEEKARLKSTNRQRVE